MKHTPWLILILLGCLLVLRANAQPLPEKRDVTVHITLDGKPFTGDTIDIVRADRQAVAAAWGGALSPDDDGNFRIPNMEDGDYRLHVHATLSKQDLYLPPEFTVSEKHTHFEIALEPFPILKVKLLRADGTPVRGGRFIGAMAIRPRERGLPPPPIEGKIDEATGIAEVPLRQLGTITSLNITVEGVGYGISTQPLEVAPHQPLEITLKLRVGGAIQVRVLETEQAIAPGGPIPLNAISVGGIRLSVQNQADQNIKGHLPQRDGTGPITQDGDTPLRLDHLAPGNYIIRPIRINDDMLQSIEQTVQVKDGETVSVAFYVKPLRMPVLHLQFLNEAAIPLARVSVMLSFTGDAGGAGDNERRKVRNFLQRAGTTDVTGKLTLYPMPKGSYNLTARLKMPDGGYRALVVDAPVQITGQDTTIKLTAQRGE